MTTNYKYVKKCKVKTKKTQTRGPRAINGTREAKSKEETVKQRGKSQIFREGLRLELQLDKDACGVGIGAATGKEVSGGAAAENGKTKWNSEGLRLRKKKKMKD